MGVEQNNEKSLELSLKAIELGSIYAFGMLSSLNVCNPKIIEQNYERIIKSYEKSIELGNTNTVHYLNEILDEDLLEKYIKHKIKLQTKLKKTQEELKKDKKYINHLEYMPGGPEMLKAQERFNNGDYQK